MEPTSSHPLQANGDQEKSLGKVNMDTKYLDVNDNNMKSSDIASTLATIKYDDETFISVSVDTKDITKLTSSQPQVQEYVSPEGAHHKQPTYSYGKYVVQSNETLLENFSWIPI